MAKNNHEIHDFSAGTITNGDWADIPDGAASDSLNISPTSKLGAAQTILSNREIMTGIPEITSMVVRDGSGEDRQKADLAVNIGSLFILIPDYRSDSMLGDFVKVAGIGQIFTATITDGERVPNTLQENPDTWDAAGGSVTVDTARGYGYELTLAHVVDSPIAVAGKLEVIDGTDGTTPLKFLDGTTFKEYLYTTTIQETFFSISDSVTIKITDGNGGGSSDWVGPARLQLSRAKYLFGDFGEGLDFTESDRGLFIGSDSHNPPMLQHKARDKQGNVNSYLVGSPCATPTSQNSLANIDHMVWVKDDATVSGGTDYRLICGVAGVDKVFQLIQNQEDPAVPYYEFRSSASIPGLDKGVGGFVKSASPNTFWTWDFEGFAIHKVTINKNSTTTDDFTGAIAATYTIKFNSVPDGGWIANIAEGVAEPNKLYVLFTKGGGLKEEDTILGYIDITTDGAKDITTLYKIPEYLTPTAYSGHSYRKTKILKIKKDVNPTGPVDFYWPKSSGDNNAMPVGYRNGGYADLSHDSQYGYVHDVCWVNTAAAPINMDVAEGGLAVTTLDGGAGDTHDVVWFGLQPLGDTKWLEYSGVWRIARQWPNWTPDSWTGSDGEWTNKTADQNLTQNSALVAVAVHDTTTDTSPDIKPFAFIDVVASGEALKDKWDNLYATFLELDAFVFPTELLSSTYGPYIANNEATIHWSSPDVSENGDYYGDTITNLALRMNTEFGFFKNLSTHSAYKRIRRIVKTYATGSDEELDVRDFQTLLRTNTVLSFGDAYTAITPMTRYGPSWMSKTADDFYLGGDFTPFVGFPAILQKMLTQTQELISSVNNKTIAKMNEHQIKHFWIGSNRTLSDVLKGEASSSPFSTGFERLEGYTDTHNYLLASTNTDSNSAPKLSEAKITSDAGTALVQWNSLDVEWIDRHTGSESSPSFVTPIDTEDGEAEISEFSAIFKPAGTTHSIKNEADDDTDDDIDRGALVSTYSGDLILKNYTLKDAPDSEILPKFNSGDLTVGLNWNKTNSVAFVPETGTITKFATAHGDISTIVTANAAHGLTNNDAITITGTTSYNGTHTIQEVTESTFTVNIPFVADDATGTWSLVPLPNESPFLANETWTYNMSLLYDGYQEGPLMASPVTIGPLDVDYTYLAIDVKLRNKNPRVTDVQLYRKRSNDEKFRLVKSLPFDTEWEENPAGGSEMISGLNLSVKDYGKTGIAYDALTGMPETLMTTNFTTYAESETIGNYLFVANARHPKLPDARKMIFRSQPGKFSIFNWAADYIGMPEHIHTLKAHNNRIYAFSKKAMYRIDPYQLIIEQEYLGMGLGDKASTLSIDGKMYIANKNGVYLFNAGNFAKINQTIEDKYQALWKRYETQKVILAMDKRYNSLLVMFDNAGVRSIDYSPDVGYAYSIDKRRWDIWNVPAKIKAQCINEDNELMVCAVSSFVKGQTEGGVSLTVDRFEEAYLDGYGEPDSTKINSTEYVHFPYIDGNLVGTMNESGNEVNPDYEGGDPVAGKDGHIVTNPYSLYEFHKGETNLPMEWTTKTITLGEDTRDKKIKTIKLIGKDIALDSMTIDGTVTDFKVTNDLNETLRIAPTSVNGVEDDDDYYQEWRLNRTKNPHDDTTLNLEPVNSSGKKRIKGIRLKVVSVEDLSNEDSATEPTLKSLAITWAPKSFK